MPRPLWSDPGRVRIASRSGCIWRRRSRSKKSFPPWDGYRYACKTAAAEPARAHFPPQARDWQLPSEAALTPHALRRVCREAAQQPFDRAAAALNEDWGLDLDGKQIQRWTQPVGARLARERDAEVRASESGRPPEGPENPPVLLAIGVDGGRIQMRDADPETGTRWREDKVAALTTYQPTPDGPQPLVTTYVATLERTEAFGKTVRVEAERRGLNRARQVLVLGDGGNWIDPLVAREFSQATRILDWYHATEHLHACARAAYGPDSPKTESLADQLKTWLWEGQTDRVIKILERWSLRVGTPRTEDGPDHPRRVLAANVEYMRQNQPYMNYPEYRRRGWPIGSGNVEAGVKQFNKRLKGTEQFWQPSGAEAMLCLRALWLNQDKRWKSYWRSRPAYRAA